MAPKYDITLLASSFLPSKELGPLIKGFSEILWKRGAVISDIKSWGNRDLAYRIRKMGQNHYQAQYLTMSVYCSPETLKDFQSSLNNNNLVLRHMSLKEKAYPKLDKQARNPYLPKPPEGPVPTAEEVVEKAKYEYRNLVMQRIFEGRTKQEIVAEQLVRQRFIDTK